MIVSCKGVVGLVEVVGSMDFVGVSDGAVETFSFLIREGVKVVGTIVLSSTGVSVGEGTTMVSSVGNGTGDVAMGCFVGLLVGGDVGAMVIGRLVGLFVGALVGSGVGTMEIGRFMGLFVGELVGSGVVFGAFSPRNA